MTESSSKTDDAKLDSRRHAYRPDLADARLEGRVASDRFVTGVRKQVRQLSAPLKSSADATRGNASEVLLGEIVSVFDEAGGWAWVQCARDDYVGYVPAPTLSAEIAEPTHTVAAPATFIYPQPDIKCAPYGWIGLNAAVSVASEGERFATLTTGGHVIARHLRPKGTHARDFVEVAESLLHTPYLWGGCTRGGIDCSGLVQMALHAAGQSCPRDSDMQAAELGHAVPVRDDLEGLERGDLVFWPGHVGVMIDAIMLLHANGHHMATVIEPLSQAVRRIAKGDANSGARGPAISAIRRLSPAPPGASS
jgi:cell wall-associated NlpC family hydrolase